MQEIQVFFCLLRTANGHKGKEPCKIGEITPKLASSFKSAVRKWYKGSCGLYDIRGDKDAFCGHWVRPRVVLPCGRPKPHDLGETMGFL